MATKKTSKNISHLFSKKGVYVVSSSKNYDIELMKGLRKKTKKPGIYVALRKSPSDLMDLMGKQQVDASNFFFIGYSSGKKEASYENCLHIKSRNSLTELSLAITTALNSGQFGFIVFDSMTTLLLYNKLGASQKFTRFLLNKVKDSAVSMVLLSVKGDKDTEKLLPSIAEFCDECVDLG